MRATERIPLRVTSAQEARFTKKAKALKLTVNEFLTRAAQSYDPSGGGETIEPLVAQLKKSTNEATAALTVALNACMDSNSRIAQMESAHVARGR